MPGNEDVVERLIGGSPYGAHLGLVVESIEPDRVRVKLPFRPEMVTIGDVVHGGAISSLIDTAATAAVWSGADLSSTTRGTTIGFTVSFLSAAKAEDVVADARVIQRGRSIVVADVEARSPDGRVVARALVTYKVG